MSYLQAYAAEAGVNITSDAICFYYGPVNEQDDGPVEICMPVDGNPPPAGDILVHKIPAHQGAIGVASPEHSKSPAILEVWDAVISWVHTDKLNMTIVQWYLCP